MQWTENSVTDSPCSFSLFSVVGQVHSPLHSEFSTEGDNVLPLSISNILFFSLSSSSLLPLLPRLPVTFVLPFICLSTTYFRSQFLRKVWPIQLAFLVFVACRLFFSSSSTVCYTSLCHTIGPADLHPSSGRLFKISQLLVSLCYK